MSETTDTGLASRRVVLAGAAGLGAAAALAACGTSSDTGTTSPTGGATGTATSNTGGGTGGALAKKSDIPEGGGKIFAQEKVVITQPTAGTFKAFTAICTHMGCTVGSISGGIIQCPCHGSQYSIVDGSVKGGPAPRALAAKTLKIDGDNLSIG